MQGWHKSEGPKRQYHNLTDYKIVSSVENHPVQTEIIREKMRTSMVSTCNGSCCGPTVDQPTPMLYM